MTNFPRSSRMSKKEGSPTLLGDKRIEGSVWLKSIRGSTPKIKGTCQIEKSR